MLFSFPAFVELFLFVPSGLSSFSQSLVSSETQITKYVISQGTYRWHQSTNSHHLTYPYANPRGHIITHQCLTNRGTHPRRLLRWDHTCADVRVVDRVDGHTDIVHHKLRPCLFSPWLVQSFFRLLGHSGVYIDQTSKWDNQGWSL